MDKSFRDNSSQFFIAGELCRRGYSAVVTQGNAPNTDIYVSCSNLEGTKFVHLQVKTFVPTDKTCSVGIKAEKDYGKNFFWILGGIPRPEDIDSDFVYYIIPSQVISENIKRIHLNLMSTSAKDQLQNNDLTIRTVDIPPYKNCQENLQWDITPFKNRWDLIAEELD